MLYVMAIQLAARGPILAQESLANGPQSSAQMLKYLLEMLNKSFYYVSKLVCGKIRNALNIKIKFIIQYLL